jgi:tRNA(fMet)-specific endonuclease VapC
VQRNLLIGQFDILIAAIALEHNLIVVTNNSIHFSRVAGLQIEDWT